MTHYTVANGKLYIDGKLATRCRDCGCPNEGNQEFCNEVCKQRNHLTLASFGVNPLNKQQLPTKAVQSARETRRQHGI